MGKPTGFKEYPRELPRYRDPQMRIQDYRELYEPFEDEKTAAQAARCMDCGVPFCHSGCPLGNIIPEFNDAVYKENWALAYRILASTNNFPEFTGRICPAPCEASCVLGINHPPVAIEHIEKSIIEKAWELNLVQPQLPAVRTGKKIAVIGSGPAGLAAADQLNKAGHWVTVFERDLHPGGLLRYGIPDFKLEKWVVERRIDWMKESGIVFNTGVEVGKDITAKELQAGYDAIVLAGGSTIPRDLNIPGRNLAGVHFAMEFLSRQNKKVSGEWKPELGEISAKDKRVVVIGGGDTGSDCVGTSNRHGAKSILQIELLGKPPEGRSADNPWPTWPMILRTSSSHEEGCDRDWAVNTKAFLGDAQGRLRALQTIRIEWKIQENGKYGFSEVAGSEEEIPCELALIAAGFVHPQHDLLMELGVMLDERRNVHANNYQTSVPHIFSAGDMRRGQSLVVWAISEGRECARELDKYLMGSTTLPSKDVN